MILEIDVLKYDFLVINVIGLLNRKFNLDFDKFFEFFKIVVINLNLLI